MRLLVVAIGTRMPAWVEDGYQEYAKRLPAHCRLQLIEVQAYKRAKGADIERALREEGQRLLAAVPAGARIIALERSGRAKTTEQLAKDFQAWLAAGTDVALLVGGPEGLDPDVLRRSHEHWSLSELTLPHPLVRVLLAEQLYRAWSLIQGLPYHR